MTRLFFLCFQVKKRNVLFIDHPVGSGFSYVTDNTLYAKTDREVGKNIIYIKTIVPPTQNQYFLEFGNRVTFKTDP